jgi:hypothetical protein
MLSCPWRAPAWAWQWQNGRTRRRRRASEAVVVAPPPRVVWGVGTGERRRSGASASPGHGGCCCARGGQAGCAGAQWARAGGEAGCGCGYIYRLAPASCPARGAGWLLGRPLSLAGGWMGRERFRTGDSGGWFGLPWVVCWCWPDVGTHADTDE